MKILAIFPTRGRPTQFVQTFNKYINTCDDRDKVEFFITVDRDDLTMKPVIPTLTGVATVIEAVSTGKIHACNRDVHKGKNWDILILISDDMIPQVQGWDTIIRESMEEHYPNTDGVLFFPDGYSALNTMCILGKKYYDRFGYIYHPDYISLWSDNEFMEVAEQLGKQTKFSQVLFKHEHWANNTAISKDKYYIENEKFYYQDHDTYQRRKTDNFGL